MSAYLQYVTAFHLEGKSKEIHAKKKNKGKSASYGVENKDKASQQELVAIV